MAWEKYVTAGRSSSEVEAQPENMTTASMAGITIKALYNRNMNTQTGETGQRWQVAIRDGGLRLDAWLHNMLPEFSRALLQRTIRDGKVLVDGSMARSAQRLRGGEHIELLALPLHQPLVDKPQQIALDIVYTDAALIVLNKPAGLVVHPGAGNPHGTLVNALLYAHPELVELPRAGLVHRLDKETSGLMVVARKASSHAFLIAALQQRRISRIYQALCHGRVEQSLRLDSPIGRNPRNRIKMAVVTGAKPALSLIRPLQCFRTTSLVEVTLHTGRTHQIRVHMSHAGHPLIGDRQYGGGVAPPSFHRQALHAVSLSLPHPDTDEQKHWHRAIPQDMQTLLNSLRRDAGLIT